MVVQVDAQVAPEDARRLIGEVAAAVRMHGQSAEMSDAAAVVRDVITQTPARCRWPS